MKQLEWESYFLKLKYPFRISRSVIEERETLFVRFGQGVGEASFSIYYGETREQVIDVFEKIDGKLSLSPNDFDKNIRVLDEIADGVKSARAALEMAALDHAARLLGRSLYAYLGLSKPAAIRTTMTVALASLEEMTVRAKEAAGFSALKLKVGVEGDIERVEAVRKASSQAIRVDANGGWKADEAVEKIKKLKELGVEFVEQPLAKEDLDGYQTLAGKSALPIWVDESVITLDDLKKFKGLVSGVVLKIQKMGGVKPSMEIAYLARAMGMGVMLGCMVESSVGIAAGCHIASVCDYIDLDGNLLVTNDPYEGLVLSGGSWQLPTGFGLGVSRK
ncbi:MAG TPA: dipeptide epimerase [candidate division Zixibacteria bacterium]|nr:dipeptide epimerase [candidate division Zixibacteria bacterium]